MNWKIDIPVQMYVQEPLPYLIANIIVYVFAKTIAILKSSCFYLLFSQEENVNWIIKDVPGLIFSYTTLGNDFFNFLLPN